MNAGELFRAGRLQEAIEIQVKEVKTHPLDQGKRLFLFELLAFSGDLDRARHQIDALSYEDPDLQTAQAGYRKLVDAEEVRRRLFRDGLAPKFLLDPPGHVRLRLQAVNRLREGHASEAGELLGRAAVESPSIRGKLNGKEFALLRDCDDLFSHVLEVMAHGDYYWVPLEQVATITTNPPKYPRDLLWLPARLEVEGAAGDVFLPALYPGTHEHADDQVRLGRLTDWTTSEGGGPVLGVGSRLFLVDDDEIGLLEWRELLVEGVNGAGSSAGSD